MNNKLDTAIQIDRVWAMPNKNTFNIRPIHNLIEGHQPTTKVVDLK